MTLGGTGVGQCDWSVKSQEELGEMRWERQRDGNLWRLVGSVRSGVFILHKQMSFEGFKQTSYTIRFVFQRVTLMTTRRAD